MSMYSDLILSESSLKHYYRCGDGASPLVDLKGSENLTASGTGVVFDQTGLLVGDNNGAFDTSASTNGIASTSSHTEIGGSGSFTLEGWIKSTNATANTYFFGEGSSSSANPVVYISNDNTNAGKIKMFVRNSAGTAVSISTTTTTYNDGSVHYVALTGDRSTNTLNLYVDNPNAGAQVTSAAYPAAPYGMNQFAIGALFRTTAGNYRPAVYDEIAVYNTALPVATLYNHYVLGKRLWGNSLAAQY